MTSAPEPSALRRQLGRSRHYTQADLPGRLLQWHAPRANRWERLCVDAGPLALEWLGVDGVTSECLRSRDERWIAPGTRWRIARLDAGARFRLEIFADDATAASAPLALRAALLDAAECVGIDDEAALVRQLADLRPGERRLVRARFDFGVALRTAIAGSGGTLCWHPLDAGPGRTTALVSRSMQVIGLAEYLGRDHAVLEAALAGALRGDAERATWLRNVLARHLVIEEELLFPAYLEAGGNAGWVRGLCNEHKHLKFHLEHLADAQSRRRFLLLLDGHDEKEEQFVYPDILARLGADAEILGRQAMLLNAP
ncbi:MAG TPA: hemerythrin domain-containing protein [Rudaea sp.]|nr:hemerythrin domain-containing protein [Rudaea sp.]